MTWLSNYIVYYINGFQMVENAKPKATPSVTVMYYEGIKQVTPRIRH